MTEPKLPKNPIEHFDTIFAEAKRTVTTDPTAMVLSTCTSDGRPSSRVVLLKHVTPSGFTFFTNYFSRKSRELDENKFAALCFYWPEINKQIRIEGTVKQVPPAVSDEYFASRPRESQLGAWASDQSQPLPNRGILLKRFKEFEKKYEGQPVPRPPYWGGFLLRPTSIEFWTNVDHRLHDRFLYTWDDLTESWTIQRLNP